MGYVTKINNQKKIPKKIAIHLIKIQLFNNSLFFIHDFLFLPIRHYL